MKHQLIILYVALVSLYNMDEIAYYVLIMY